MFPEPGELALSEAKGIRPRELDLLKARSVPGLFAVWESSHVARLYL